MRKLLGISLGLVGCVTTPREVPTVQDLIKHSKPAPRCEHLVEFVDRDRANRPYTELSRASVTCHPALPDLCERSLRDKACEVGADAVLLVPATSGASRSVPNTRDQVWKDAVLARWR
jgi:hypothetical protein